MSVDELLDDGRRQELEATLRNESALPFWAYTDERFHELEMRKAFHRDWVFACFAEEVPEPGDFYSFDVAGEAVVVSRTEDGGLRALSNTCSHRGTLLVEGTGNTKNFSCPYHGWTYRGDGSLLSVPFNGGAEVDKDALCLPQFRVEEWNEFVFVSLNPDVESLTERFAGIEAHLGTDFFPGYKRKRKGRQSRIEHPVNWKLLAENLTDGYHIFKAHPHTLEPTTPTKTAFYVDGNEHWSISGIGESSKALHEGGGVGEIGQMSGTAMLFLSLPPSFGLIISTDYVIWQLLEPTAIDHTIQWIGTASHPDTPLVARTKEERRFYRYANAATKEDGVILDLVQAGSKSAMRRPGPMIAPIENSNILLHQLLARRVLDR